MSMIASNDKTHIKHNLSREGMPLHIIASREGKNQSRENNK